MTSPVSDPPKLVSLASQTSSCPTVDFSGKLDIFPIMWDDVQCAPSTVPSSITLPKVSHSDYDDLQLLHLDKHVPPLLSRQEISQGLRDFSVFLTALLDRHRSVPAADPATVAVTLPPVTPSTAAASPEGFSAPPNDLSLALIPLPFEKPWLQP